jgi:hypothetical protein
MDDLAQESDWPRGLRYSQAYIDKCWEEWLCLICREHGHPWYRCRELKFMSVEESSGDEHEHGDEQD